MIRNKELHILQKCQVGLLSNFSGLYQHSVKDFAFFSLKIFLTNMNACLRTLMRCQQPDVGWINDILIPQPNAPLAKVFLKVGNQVITLIWSEELGLSGMRNQPDQSFYWFRIHTGQCTDKKDGNRRWEACQHPMQPINQEPASSLDYESFTTMYMN